MRPKYEVQIQTIWKGEPLIIKAAQNDRDTKVINIRIDSVIHTSFDKCGLNLSTGKKYILSGNILGNKLYVTNCHWHLEWNIESKRIRRRLRRAEFHCRCLIEPCFTKTSCNNQRNRYTCHWPIKFKPRDCRFRTCQYEAGGCRWSKYIEMDVCKNARGVHRLKYPSHF